MEPCTQSTSAFQFCYIWLPPSILKQTEPSSTKVIYSIWSAPTFLLIYVLYRKSWHATLPDHPELGRFMQSLITDCSKYLKILTSLKSFKSGRRWTRIQVCTASERHSTVGTPQRVAGDRHTERRMRMCRGWSTLMTHVKEVLNMEHTKRTPVQFTASKKADLHTWFWHRIGHGLRDFVVDEFNTFTGKESNLE